MINGHGDDIHQFKTPIKYNFSSNVYYKGCPTQLLDELKNNVNNIQSYPSPVAQELANLAAKHFNLNPNQFLFSNGATEAFYLICQHYKGKNAIIVGPTFAEYEDACKINNVSFQFIKRNEISTTNYTNCLVFICNPNNPDGKILPIDEIENLLKNFPKAHFVIDEAYYEFTHKPVSSLSLVSKYSNITIVRSLTKTFTMPGLRLGYVVSNKNFISELLQIKMPWSVNSLAIASGKFIFENYNSLSFNVEVLMEETELFKSQLNELDFLKVQEGYTSYFLVELQKGTASKLKEYLVNEHQILIRDATNFTGLKGEYIRLAVQDKLANKTLIKALLQWN